MPDSITCARCGMTSRHPDDIREGYCGRCHAPAAPLPWSRPDADPLADIRESVLGAAPVAGETALTPEALLTDERWLFEGFSGGEARFRFSPAAEPWMTSWRPDSSLGAFTADWTRGDTVQLRVRREVIERAAADLAGQVPVRRLMQPSCLALLAVLKAMHPAAPVPGQEPDTWHCESCGRFMQVPPGRDLVLCGYHEVPERMALIQLTDLHSSALSMAVQVRDADFSVLRSRQDEMITDMVLSAPPGLAGLAVETGTELTETQARELEQQIRGSLGTGPAEPERRRVWRARENPAARRARVLDQAEEMIARLDGEGYGVRAKANRADAGTVSTPELPLLDHEHGGNAARWSPEHPVM